MGMPVEVVTRLRDTDQPVNGFQTLVRLCIVIVDPKRGGVRDQNIEGATVVHPVQQQSGKHTERP